MIKHLCLNRSTRKLYWYKGRTSLDANFIRLKNLIKLLGLIVIDIGTLIGIYLMRSVMMFNSSTDKRHDLKTKHKGTRPLASGKCRGNLLRAILL